MNKFNELKVEFNKNMVQLLTNIIDSEELLERVLYCLEKGKRLRPVMAIDICNELAGNRENALKFATAIELIHNSSLIIDDMPCMDNDDYRRGKLSFHKKYSVTQGQITAKYLVNLAFRLVNENFQNHDNEIMDIVFQNICKNIGILGAAGGQLMDIVSTNCFGNKKELLNNSKKKDIIRDLFMKKTCSFFEIAFLGGYLTGNGNIENLELVKKAAFNFGIAFQIYDDFDDIEQDLLRRNSNLNDPNYINNFGVEEAFKDFIAALDNFRTIMQSLSLYSSVMEKLHDFLLAKVNNKYKNL